MPTPRGIELYQERIVGFEGLVKGFAAKKKEGEVRWWSGSPSDKLCDARERVRGGTHSVNTNTPSSSAILAKAPHTKNKEANKASIFLLG